MVLSSTLRKVVTAKEIRSGRIPIPARVRDHALPYLAQNTCTDLTMVDENGASHAVRVRLRRNRTKTEIVSGGRRFAIRRNLVAGAILEFSRSHLPGHFNVTVRPPQSLILPVEELGGLLPMVQPPTERLSAEMGEALGISADKALGRPQKPTVTTMELGLGLSTCSIPPPSPANMKVEPPTLRTMELELGLSMDSVQPRSPANMRVEPPTTTPEEPPTPMAMELGLSLSIGSVPPLSPASMQVPPNSPSADIKVPTLNELRPYSIAFDHRQLSTEMVAHFPTPHGLGFRLSMDSDHPLFEPSQPFSSIAETGFEMPPNAVTTELGLGSSSSDHAPPPKNMPPGSSKNLQAATPEEAHELDLNLATGTNIHHPITPPPAPPLAPELSLSLGFKHAATSMTLGRIKSEVQVISQNKTNLARPFYGGLYPDLSYSLEYSSFLHRPKNSAKAHYPNPGSLATVHDQSEQKTARELLTENPRYSAFLPYVPSEPSNSRTTSKACTSFEGKAGKGNGDNAKGWSDQFRNFF